MAIGNILGYATGAYSGWYKVLPFTLTIACDKSCANLKSAFLLAIIMLTLTTIMSITAASEIPLCPSVTCTSKKLTNSTVPMLLCMESSTQISHDNGTKEAFHVSGDEEEEGGCELEQEAFFWELFGTLRDLPKPMQIVLLVTALTWFSWFPFILFDTDWMGHEVYLGEPSVTDAHLAKLYHTGVRVGSFGLMLNSIVLGIFSLLIEPLCRKVGQKCVWAAANFIMCACFSGTVVISVLSKDGSYSASGYPPPGILWSAIGIFAVLGIPLAVGCQCLNMI